MFQKIIELFRRKRQRNLDFLTKVDLMNDALVNQILKDKKLNSVTFSKSNCEVRMFLFFYSLPIVQKYASNQLFEEYLSDVPKRVVFKDIDKNEFSEEYLMKLLNERKVYHLTNLSNLDNFQLSEGYFAELYALWSSEAFSDLSNMGKIVAMNALKEGNLPLLHAPLQVGTLLSRILPIYRDGLIKALGEEQNSKY